MADPVDRSDQETEAFLATAKAKREKEGPKATGRCLCCNAQLAPGLRWCDKLCQEDWEIDEKQKAKGV